MEISQPAANTYLVHLNRGESVIASLTRFARENHIGMAQVSGIGGVKNVKLGCFKPTCNQFSERTFSDYSELIHAEGNISCLEDGQPFVHLHASFADQSFQVYGGHLFEAETHVVCEFFVHTQKEILSRRYNPTLNIHQWDQCSRLSAVV